MSVKVTIRDAASVPRVTRVAAVPQSKGPSPNDRKCSHEYFKYCNFGSSPITFVFERSHYVTPTDAHLDDYRRAILKDISQNWGGVAAD